jgi:glycosyltransferase involved in cell wall biosynthesis
MRVLIVTIPLPTASQPNSMAPLLAQIRSLQAIGVGVDVLEIRGLPKVKYLLAWSALQRYARQVDLVHCHYGYCGWLGRAQLQKPVVVSFMGDDLLGTPDVNGNKTLASRGVVQLDRWFARTVDAVIVKSAEMARVVHPVEAHVVPNGVDLGVFRPIERRLARARLGWPQERRYVLFPASTTNPHKCYPLAQAAVARASAKINQPVQLVPLERVPADTVPLYMNACEAMVMTSFAEGSPNVVKEAMACNTPIVSVAVGDVPELFAGVSGYALCPRDERLLGEALAGVLTRPPQAHGRAAIQAKGLDLDSVARRVLGIYTTVVSSGSAARLSA